MATQRSVEWWAGRYSQAKERIAELEADKTRLDFLDDLNRRLNEFHGTTYGWAINSNANRIRVALEDHNLPALSIRDAIDKAMISDQPEQGGSR